MEERTEVQHDLSGFTEGLVHYGVTLNENQLRQFMIYYENLIRWNKVMNLTAITEFNDVIHKHFLDSLSITEVISPEQLHRGGKLIDVGTGAGFPGIPLAIAFPELKITLLDSLQKRVNFLNDTIEKTGLKNIAAIHSRAEEAGRNRKYRENYDYTVSEPLPICQCSANTVCPSQKKAVALSPINQEMPKKKSGKPGRQFGCWAESLSHRKNSACSVQIRKEFLSLFRKKQKRRPDIQEKRVHLQKIR